MYLKKKGSDNKFMFPIGPYCIVKVNYFFYWSTVSQVVSLLSQKVNINCDISCSNNYFDQTF